MFIQKANSKQKRVKKLGERETGYAVREQLASATKSHAMTSCDR